MDQENIRMYYQEFDPLKRGRILEELLEENSGDENLLRREIYNLRYDKSAQKKSGIVADGYVNLWMSMKYSADNSGGWFGLKGARRELKKLLDKLGIPGFLEREEAGSRLLYEEFYHLGALYINSSQTDRNYTTSLMGMMAMKPEAIYGKLASDVYKVGYVMPKRVGMETEFALFTEAVTKAFCDILPDYREYLQELINKK